MSCNPDKCGDCPSKGNCGSSTESPDNAMIAEKIQSVGNIFIVLSGKGGCGKSTVATQLAYYVSEACGKQVGLLDIDICGPSIPTMTRTQTASIHPTALGWEPVSVTDNLSVVSIGFMLANVDDPVVLRGPKKHGIIIQFLKEVNWHFNDDTYAQNYLIIDTPPGTSDEHLSVINTLAAAVRILEKVTVDGHGNPIPGARRPNVYAIVVSTPQEVALVDVRKEINFCKQINLKIIGVIENMSGFVCPCCNRESHIFHGKNDGVQKLCTDYQVPYLGRIPLDPALTKCGEEGKPWAVGLGVDGGESLGYNMFKDIAGKLMQE